MVAVNVMMMLLMMLLMMMVMMMVMILVTMMMTTTMIIIITINCSDIAYLATAIMSNYLILLDNKTLSATVIQ